MDITVIANVLLDLFELQAAVGAALLAVVIVTLVRALVVAHHRHGLRSTDRTHR